MHSAKLFRVATMVGLALLAAVGTTRAYDLIRQNGQPITWWPGSVTMQLKLDNTRTLQDGTTFAMSAVAAMDAWNAVLGDTQLTAQIQPVGIGTDGDNNHEIFFASDLYGDAFGANVLAVTTDYYSTTARSDGSYPRVEADIIFNSTYTWDSYRGPLQYPEEFRRVAIHELGHVLGLDHPDQATPPQTVDAIMNHTVSDRGALAQDDINGAQYLYGAPGSVAHPGNDNFSSAYTIAAGTTQVSGSNLWATKQHYEPAHAPGQYGGASIWWKWTAPSSGSLTITTEGSNFDTLLAAYTGGSVNALTQLAANDDVESGVIRTSTITFNVSVGTTYYIAVDGWDGLMGNVTVNLAFTPTNTDVAPSITQQPSNQSVTEGQATQFTVSASGSPVPNYLWQRLPAGSGTWGNLSNDGNYSGVSTATLTVSATAVAMNGDRFRCVATNTVGTATSNEATLSVQPNIAPPAIVSRPLTRTLVAGQSATFTVGATGGGTLTYQWRHNGKSIAGQAGSSLTLSTVAASHAGYYEVLISNSVGTARSVFYVHVATPNRVLAGWGDNNYGQTNVPTTPDNWVQVAAGPHAGYALKGDGTVVSWSAPWVGTPPTPAEATNVVSLVAGWAVLAVCADGTVVGWNGANSPQLPVPSGLSGVVDVVLGGYHALALKADGKVVAWGENYYQQTNVPANLGDVVAVSAGYTHSLALLSNGTVVQWGYYSGVDLTVPAGLSGVVAIAAGYSHNLALKSDGTVVAWGSNYSGEATVPSGTSGIVAIRAVGSASYLLKADGSMVTFGNNSYGQLDVPPGVQIETRDAFVNGGNYSLAITPPVPPGVITHPTSTSVNENGVLMLSISASGIPVPTTQWRKDGIPLVESQRVTGTSTSTLRLYNFSSADVGSYDAVVTNIAGSATSNIAAVTLNPLPSLQQPARSRLVSAGSPLVLDATTVTASTYSWSHNGIYLNRSGPVLRVDQATPADGGVYVVWITNAVGSIYRIYHVRITRSNEVVAWGANDSGQTAIPDGVVDITELSAGNTHAVALKGDGTLVAWGGNVYGQATAPAGLTKIVQVSAGDDHTLALKEDGTVVAWGRNDAGQCNVPAGLTDVVQVAGGGSHSVVLKSDGSVVAWGGNQFGQSTVPAPSNSQVTMSIGAGETHTLAYTNLGPVAWGSNQHGESIAYGWGVTGYAAGNQFTVWAAQGSGKLYGRGSIVAPSDFNGITSLSARGGHFLALSEKGIANAWGKNGTEQAEVPADLGNVQLVAAGGDFYLAAVSKTPPSILSHPENLTVAAGSNAAFTVVASGVTSYRWFKDGLALSDADRISGSATASLTIIGALNSDAGRYRVRLTNRYGTVESSDAELTIEPLRVAINPASSANADSSLIKLGVTVTGAGPYSYQWYRGETGDLSQPVAGETNSETTVTQTVSIDHYWVRVASASGTCDSDTMAVGQWAQIEPFLGANFIQAVASGGEVHVAVGGTAIYSADGQNWQTASIENGVNLQSVLYDGTRFVAAGYRGQVHVSSDGRSWQKLRNPDDSGTDSLYSGASGNGITVFVGSVGKLMSSVDGVIWTWRTIEDAGVPVYLRSVAYGAGRFVAVGGTQESYPSGRIYQSTDGINWSRCAYSTVSPDNNYVIDTPGGVFYIGGHFVVFAGAKYSSNKSFAYLSSDGLSWNNAVSTSRAVDIGSIRTIGTMLVDGAFQSSADGVAWTAAPAGVKPSQVATFGYANGSYFAFTGSSYSSNYCTLWSSPDMGLWIRRSGYSIPTAVAYGNDRFVAISGSGGLYSDTGSNWKSFTLPGSYSFGGFAFGNGLFVAGNSSIYSGYTHYTSPDGVTWTGRNATTAEQKVSIYNVVYAGGKWVGLGDGIFTSDDAVSWTRQYSFLEFTVGSIAYGNGVFVGVGSYGHVLTSPDAVTWTDNSGNRPTVANFTRVVFGAGMFVAYDNSNTIWSSVDGAQWTQRGSYPRYITALAFDDGMFMAARGVDLLTSRDGNSWQTIPGALARVGADSWASALQLIYAKKSWWASTSSGAWLRMPVVMALPMLSASPASRIISSDSPTTLAVIASGAGLAYQWYLGYSGDTSNPIGGASSAEYTTPPLSADARYWVRVSNADGSVDSATVTVSIGGAPQILAQPQDADVVQGTPALLSVSATGTPMPNYQWYRGASGDVSRPISGATSSSYLTPAASAVALPYWVRASSQFGSVDSDTATVTPWQRNVSANPYGFYKSGDDTLRALAREGWMISTDGLQWIYVQASQTMANVVFGNGVYVGYSGQYVYSSSDGLVWTRRYDTGGTQVSALAFGAGGFVAAVSGQPGYVLNSSDGISWRSTSLGSDGGNLRFASICYSAGLFVGVGYDSTAKGAIMTSSDGVLWTRRSVSFTGLIWDASFTGLESVSHAGQRYFTFGGFSGVVASSADGINWVQMTSPSPYAVKSIGWANGTYCLVDGSDRYYTSTDCVTWTTRYGPRGFQPQAIHDFAGRFVAVSSNGAVHTSSDAVEWDVRVNVPPVGNGSGVASLTYGGGRFVSSGSSWDDYYSADGVVWSMTETAVGILSGGQLLYALERFYCTDTEFTGKYWSSTNGATWQAKQISGFTEIILRFEFANNMVMAIGVNGALATSSDGENWTMRTTGLVNSLRGVAYGNGRYVGLTGSGMMRSSDLTTWTNTAVSDVWIEHVRFGNGVFVAVGRDGSKVLVSPDGDTWTLCQISGLSYGNGEVEFDGQRFWILGRDSLLTSVDGVAWRTRRLPFGYASHMATSGHTTVISNDSFWSCTDLGGIITISTQPSDSRVVIGAGASFGVAASGKGVIYRWQVAPPGTTSWTDVADDSRYSGSASPTLALTNATLVQSGTQFRCIVSDGVDEITSRPATLTVYIGPPVIVQPPISRVVAQGADVQLSVVASSPVEQGYQWLFGDTEIPGATSDTLSLANFQAANSGTYSVRVTNAGGSVTSSATVEVATLPTITTQPQSVTRYAGENLTLSVTATSNAPITYQWKKDGAVIEGATQATLQLGPISAADAGDYRVVVSNAAGTITSAIARLTVLLGTAPVITVQPQTQLTGLGGRVAFTVVATGSPAPTYRWQRLAVGATQWEDVTATNSYSSYGWDGPTLIALSTATDVNSGHRYRVIVSNLLGSVTSQEAVLNISGYAAPTTVVAGYTMTTVIRADGQSTSTGANNVGQYGDGTTNSIRNLLTPFGGPQALVSAHLGFEHSMFIKVGAELWVAGDNQLGQLGDGTTTTRSTPVRIPGAWAGAAGGYRHSLFRANDGQLFAVGWNSVGQLGDGTVVNRTLPVKVADHVVAVAAGFNHSLFVKGDGTAFGMGNNNGLFGDGGITGSLAPMQIATNVADVASFYHTAFLKRDGTVWTTGRNDRGQLGLGDIVNRTSATLVSSGVVEIAVGALHTVMLKSDGTVWTFGANDRGQLGDNSTTDRRTPVQVASDVATISAGLFTTAILKNDGSVWMTGANDVGQLGDNTTTDRASFVQVATGQPALPSDTVIPSATVSDSADRIALSWTPSRGATYYRVWRHTTNEAAQATLLAPRVKGTYFEDTTASAGVTYHYWVQPVNSFGQWPLLSSTVGRYGVAVVAPSITSQPVSQNASAGASVTFTVTATGSPPFAYQWMKGDAQIPAANSASYTIADVKIGDSGEYSVIVSNAAGFVASTTATLTVNKVAQTIDFPPLADCEFSTSVIVLYGAATSQLPVTFSVVSGPATISGSNLMLTGVGTVTIRASQAGDSTFAPAADVERSFVVRESVAAWQNSFFTEAELLDTAISGPNADPDGDGIPNLVEYALGLDPKSASVAALPAATLDSGNWSFTYTRPSDRTDIHYSVECSTDLTNWSEVNVTHALVTAQGGTETWSATYPAASAPNCFFRLVVTH